jgi:hypothetical protein
MSESESPFRKLTDGNLVTGGVSASEFTSVDGPKGFATWAEPEGAGRFLQPVPSS